MPWGHLPCQVCLPTAASPLPAPPVRSLGLQPHTAWHWEDCFFCSIISSPTACVCAFELVTLISQFHFSVTHSLLPWKTALPEGETMSIINHSPFPHPLLLSSVFCIEPQQQQFLWKTGFLNIHCRAPLGNNCRTPSRVHKALLWHSCLPSATSALHSLPKGTVLVISSGKATRVHFTFLCFAPVSHSYRVRRQLFLYWVL